MPELMTKDDWEAQADLDAMKRAKDIADQPGRKERVREMIGRQRKELEDAEQIVGKPGKIRFNNAARPSRMKIG